MKIITTLSISALWLASGVVGADPAVTPSRCCTPQVELSNVALGKRVTSGVAEAGGYKRAASRLTDGNMKTDAYPGRFNLDYTVDLGTFAEGGPDASATAFDVSALTIHWGKFGRHFPGVKAPGGGWARAAYKADYVNTYSIQYQSQGAEVWTVLHEYKGRPTDEDADRVTVIRIPESASFSEGEVVTRLDGLSLKGVSSVRLCAKGAHWIGVHELEVWGGVSQ